MALKNIFVILLFLCAQIVCGQTILWEETFENESNGATSQAGASVGGTLGGTWSVTTTPTGGAASFSRQSYVYSIWFFGCIDIVTANLFLINGTGTEGVWQSNIIDISSLGDVALEMDLGISGGNSSDYVRAFYRIDGGPEIQFGEVTGNGGIPSLTNTVSAILSGSTLQIIVRGLENTAGNVTACGTPVALGFDNVRLVDITTLYSIASGNWNNSTTWSYTGYGGTTCSPCLPSNDTKIFIGNNRTVNFNAAGDAIDVNIENTGTLQWTANNIDLNIRRGGSINISSGGILTLNGNAGAQIDFDDPYTNTIDVSSGGVLSIGDIDINGGTALTLTGGGAFTVNDDFLMGVDNLVVTNNMTGTFTINDQLLFEINNMDFINNGSDMNVLGATGVVFAGANNTVINNADLAVTGATRSISFNAGATGNSVINDGTLDISNIYFDDDNNSIINTNTITLSSNILAGANDDGNTITNSGTLNFVTLSLSNANLTINNSGTINQSGNFTNIDAGSSFNNLAGGIWNWTLTPNNTYDTDLITTLNCTTVPNTFAYAASGNQSVIPITYHHLQLNGTGTKATQGNIDVNGDLSITASARLDVNAGDDNISLGGNWLVTSNNANPFDQGTGAELVTFDGVGNQTITNVNGETFNRITVNKSSGDLILNNPIVVQNGTGTDLTLTQGKIISSASALITVLDNATTNGGDADSFVDGPIRKIGNDAFVFPTGDGNIWARIGISAPASTATEFTAEYFDANFGDISNNGTLNDPSDNEYWILDRAVTTNGVRVTLYWENNVRSQINDAVSGDLVVARYNGTDWLSEGQFSISSAGSTGSVTSNVITTFSPFTFGSLGAGVNPLPVELADFQARIVENSVHLSWITSSELNNDFFTVERSEDGETFTKVGQHVPGKGTTNQTHHYSQIDSNPLKGTSYYRLKQTDFDGTFAYSNVIPVTYEGLTIASLQVFPNPATNNQLTLEFNGFGKSETVPVVIVDQLGRECYSFEVATNTSGFARHLAIFNKPLADGIYMVKAGPTLTLNKRLLVKAQ